MKTADQATEDKSLSSGLGVVLSQWRWRGFVRAPCSERVCNTPLVVLPRGVSSFTCNPAVCSGPAPRWKGNLRSSSSAAVLHRHRARQSQLSESLCCPSPCCAFIWRAIRVRDGLPGLQTRMAYPVVRTSRGKCWWAVVKWAEDGSNVTYLCNTASLWTNDPGDFMNWQYQLFLMTFWCHLVLLWIRFSF